MEKRASRARNSKKPLQRHNKEPRTAAHRRRLNEVLRKTKRGIPKEHWTEKCKPGRRCQQAGRHLLDPGELQQPLGIRLQTIEIVGRFRRRVDEVIVISVGA